MEFELINEKSKIKKIYTGFVLFCILQITSLSIYAQDLKFEHINSSTGLTSNSVFGILQDSYGFLWLRTSRGLTMYDGYEFNDFNQKQEQPFFIRCFFEDSNATLWVGTKRGLYLFNRMTESLNAFLGTKKNVLSDTYINSIYEDQYKGLWIGTSKGLFLIKEKKIIKFKHDKYNKKTILYDFIVGIGEDANKNIWIITTRGLSKFNRKNKSFDNFVLPHNVANKINRRIIALFINLKNEIWLGVKNYGLLKYSTSELIYKDYNNSFTGINGLKNNLIFNINEDSKGVIWVSTINGLFLFDPLNKRCKVYKHDSSNSLSISQNDVRCSFEDKNGNFWIGTLGGGINKIGRNSLFFHHVKQSAGNAINLNHKIVWSVYEDSLKNLWVGTDNGLNYWDNKEKKIYYFKDNSNLEYNNDFIISIFEDHKKNIWVGTAGRGLKRFNRENKAFETFSANLKNPSCISSNYVSKIFEDSSNILWIGTGKGLSKFDSKNKIFVNFLSKKRNGYHYSTHDIYEDSSGQLLIGTSNGLNIFDRKKNIFIGHPIFKLKNIDILTIYEDSYKNLWFGTNVGLFKLDAKENKIKKYEIEDGLPDERIMSIVEDNQKNLWLGTGIGLSKFNINSDLFINYFKKDGISDNEFNPRAIFKNSHGKIYVGGMNGITAFYPNKIKINKKPPNIAITIFRLFNKIVKVGSNSILKKSIMNTKEIRLKYNQNFFSFEFRVLDFTNPKQNKYKYRLFGLDKKWVSCDSKKSANYTGIAPGKYTFIVKGSNSDGIWNTKDVSINIFISPPFWETWWFRLFILTMVIISLVALYKKRMLQLEIKLRNEYAVDELSNKYKLTNREKEVLYLILEGKNNKEIEDILFISYSTVKNHVYNIFTKVGVKNRSDIILFFKSTQKINKKK